MIYINEWKELGAGFEGAGWENDWWEQRRATRSAPRAIGTELATALWLARARRGWPGSADTLDRVLYNPWGAGYVVTLARRRGGTTERAGRTGAGERRGQRLGQEAEVKGGGTGHGLISTWKGTGTGEKSAPARCGRGCRRGPKKMLAWGRGLSSAAARPGAGRRWLPRRSPENWAVKNRRWPNVQAMGHLRRWQKRRGRSWRGKGRRSGADSAVHHGWRLRESGGTVTVRGAGGCGTRQPVVQGPDTKHQVQEGTRGARRMQGS
jgi:hypothetical protein